MFVQLDHETPAGTDEPEPASSAEEPPERASGVGGLAIDLTLADPAAGLDAAWLVEHARRVGDELGVTGELRVRVVGDAEMAAAHEAHLGDATTTDVMTFDLADGAAANGEPVDADILVCVDEAARRAEEHGFTLERELLLYVVHALLHCLGHDDHDEAAFAKMHELEDALLEAVGVGATFAPRAGRGRRA